VCEHSDTFPGPPERQKELVNLGTEGGKQIGLGALYELVTRHWADFAALASSALSGVAWRQPF
jgi:hypothetical protein